MKWLCKEVDILLDCSASPHLAPMGGSGRQSMVWFGPPFGEHVKTDIEGAFLRLLGKRFPPYHRLHKICNGGGIKLSCSCMPNMAAVVSRHNEALLAWGTGPAGTVPPCSCKAGASCPMKGQCRGGSIVCKATLTTDGIAKKIVML